MASLKKANQSLALRVSALEEEVVASMKREEALGLQNAHECRFSETVERLKEAEKEREYLAQRLEQMQVRLEELQRINEETEEKKVLAKKDAVRANIKLQHLMRDVEMRENCLRSEQDYDKGMKDMRKKYEESMAEIMSKVRKIEFEKARLIDDNVKLLNENEKLRHLLPNLTFNKNAFDSCESWYKGSDSKYQHSQEKENINENIQDHDKYDNNPLKETRK